MSYIEYCKLTAIVRYNDNNQLKICVSKNPWKRINKNQIIEMIWHHDDKIIIKIKEKYQENKRHIPFKEKCDFYYLTHEELLNIANHSIEIAQQELKKFKLTSAYKRMRRKKREEIEIKKLSGKSYQSLKNFDNDLIRQNLKNSLS